MKSFEEIFSQLYEQVRQKLSSVSGCHDFDHTLRVLKNAENIATELPNANVEVVKFAALFHDVARPEEIASKGEVDHAVAGAEITSKQLSAIGVSSDIVQKVCDAIRTHRYRRGQVPLSIEAQIVYDADKLDSLGAVGIGRAFLFAGREGAKLHNSETEALSAGEYSRDDTAYREYLVKLRKLPDKMFTEPGRKIALKRKQFMDDFFAELRAETEK